MRILITGGTGFLGRHLLPMLTTHELFVLTRRPRSTATVKSTDNIELLSADLSNGIDTATLPSRIDAIIHLAQSDKYREFPAGAADMFQVNVAVPQSLMRWALGAGVTRTVFASTGSVYEPFTGPLRENTAVNPTGYYAASKLAAETLSLAYQSQMAVSQLRVFLLYGPGQTGMMTSRVIDNVRAGRPLTLPSQGDGPLLVPTYVDDTARVFKQACEEGWRGIWNVASPRAVSFTDLAHAIGVAAGRKPCFERTGTGPTPSIVADVTKLATRVDLSTFTPLALGLERTLKYASVPAA